MCAKCCRESMRKTTPLVYHGMMCALPNFAKVRPLWRLQAATCQPRAAYSAGGEVRAITSQHHPYIRALEQRRKRPDLLQSGDTANDRPRQQLFPSHKAVLRPIGSRRQQRHNDMRDSAASARAPSRRGSRMSTSARGSRRQQRHNEMRDSGASGSAPPRRESRMTTSARGTHLPTETP